MSTLNPIDLDGRTLACAAVLGMVTAVLFGLPPAYFASRTAIVDVLRRGGRAIAGVGASERLRAALVVAEVAVSMVLLVGAALMTHSLIRLTHVDRGLDATGLVALRLGLPAAGYADPSARDQFTRLVSERLRHVPGVQAVSIGCVPPETSKVVFGQVHVDGFPRRPAIPRSFRSTRSRLISLPRSAFRSSKAIPSRTTIRAARDRERELCAPALAQGGDRWAIRDRADRHALRHRHRWRRETRRAR